MAYDNKLPTQLVIICCYMLLTSCSGQGTTNETSTEGQSSDWSSPEIIAKGDAPGSISVAFSPSGKAVVVWDSNDSTNYYIKSKTFTPGAGWEATEIIQTSASASISCTQVTVDSSGNTIIVWCQNGAILAKLYSESLGWGSTEIISNTSTAASAPKVSFDSSSNAVAVWSQPDNIANLPSIWSNRYSPTTGWIGAELVEDNNLEGTSPPQLAVDPSGNALAIWYQSKDFDYTHSGDDIWANYYTAGAGWGAAELVELFDDAPAGDYSPQVSFDSFGNAAAVWRRNETLCDVKGCWSTVASNQYTPSMGWGSVEIIGSGTHHDWSPDLAFNASGEGFAVWEVGWPNVIPTYSIWANHFTMDSGWAVAEVIEDDEVGSLHDPQVAIDSEGNAIAVWIQHYGTARRLWANLYTQNSGWGVAQMLHNDASASMTIAIDSSGNAIIIWVSKAGDDVWSSYYIRPQ